MKKGGIMENKFIFKDVYKISSLPTSPLTPHKRLYQLINQKGKVYAEFDNYVEAKTACRDLNNKK